MTPSAVGSVLGKKDPPAIIIVQNVKINRVITIKLNQSSALPTRVGAESWLAPILSVITPSMIVGKNGIVGHLGCVFSEIYNNHIYNIALKREFYGYEIAGIKLHAALDVQIHDNCIHDCSLGMWLDWQAQGTRVSRNLFTVIIGISSLK